MTCVRMLELGPRAFYFLVVSVCLSIVRVPLFMLILIVIDIGPRNRLLGWLAPRELRLELPVPLPDDPERRRPKIRPIAPIAGEAIPVSLKQAHRRSWGRCPVGGCRPWQTRACVAVTWRLGALTLSRSRGD